MFYFSGATRVARIKTTTHIDGPAKRPTHAPGTPEAKECREKKGIPVCFVAYDGEEALKLFEKHNPRPCVVLMDYRMPGTNGIQATKEILRRDSQVKVIFISADEGVRKDAIKSGAVLFVQKPANVKEILAAVEGVAEM